MKVRRQRKESLLVIWGASVLMLLGMGVLVSELWKLQVPRQSGFEAEFVQQSVRRVRLPAVRGKIFDAKGVCLADSVPNYCIAIYTEELRAPRSATANTLDLIHRIWQAIGVRPDVTYRDIKHHFAVTPDEPLVAWKKLDDASLGKWQHIFGRWSEKRKTLGLKNHDPLTDDRIVIQIPELIDRPTSTEANTLELVYEIAERTGLNREKVRYQRIIDHIFAQKPLPFIAWEKIDEATMARWADTCSTLAGTDIYYQPARTYPGGETNAHILGYTKRADAIRKEAETGEKIHFDMRGIKGVGLGLESYYDDLLEGEPGYKLVRIDASGYHHSDLRSQPARPGGDLRLTIDQNIQRFATEVLASKQNGEDPYPVRGACVVLNPNNGDVLAMVSSPSFDPNLFMKSGRYASALFQDEFSKPTFNRAVFGQYPPGSTFKPIVSLGVLKEHPDYGDTLHDCRGSLVVSKRRMNCWTHRKGGHGKIDLQEALMGSCNVYMFEMAQAVGHEPILSMAEQFGIGQYAGLFPNLEEMPEQKDLKYGNLPAKANNTIDLCNMSIGQGALTASPLQMAMVAATIANGGTLYRPRLVQKWRTAPEEEYRNNPTWAIRRLDVPIEALELVRGGMHDVVMHPDGTAEQARVAGIEIAGKTGSAQYKKRVDGEVVSSVHTWMISYAPFDFPRYAVAILVEDGVSGGSTVGPRLSALYQKIFEYDGTLRKEEG